MSTGRLILVLGLVLALTSTAVAQDKKVTVPQSPPSSDPQASLSNVEIAFLDRVAKIDSALAEKIGKKLSQIKNKAAKTAYMNRRMDKIDDEAFTLQQLLVDKGLADKSKSKELTQLGNRLRSLKDELRNMRAFYMTGDPPLWYHTLVLTRRMKDVCSYITDSSWKDVCYQDLAVSHCLVIAAKGYRSICMRTLYTAGKKVRFGRTIWDFCSLTPSNGKNCFAFGAAFKAKCKQVPTKPGQDQCFAVTQAMPDDARLKVD